MVVKISIFHSADNQAVTSLMFNSLIYSVLTNWGLGERKILRAAQIKKYYYLCPNIRGANASTRSTERVVLAAAATLACVLWCKHLEFQVNIQRKPMLYLLSYWC